MESPFLSARMLTGCLMSIVFGETQAVVDANRLKCFIYAAQAVATA